jgi:hypothetical protein
MKYPLFALALFSCFTAIAAEPKLNTSSMADLEKSALRVIGWIKDSRDIGAQDKAFISNMIALRAAETEQHILDEGGPNVKQRQKDEICSKFLKKYNGLSVSELHKVFLEEVRMEAEAKEKARAEAEAAMAKGVEQKRQTQNSIFEGWLKGQPASLLELPDGSKVLADNRNQNPSGVGLRVEIAPKDIDPYSNRLNNPITVFETVESRPKAFEFNFKPEILVRVYNAAFPSRRGDSAYYPLRALGDLLWWEPKFKEWAGKFAQIPENERPQQYFKEIPNQGVNDQDVDDKKANPIYFVFDKALGVGIWVAEWNYKEDVADRRAVLESGKVLSFEDKWRDFILDPSKEKRLLGTFYDIKQLYLASSSVNLLKSELQKLPSAKTEDPNALEKSKGIRDAVEKKLNLN